MARMPWGKYRGDEVADLPSQYVVWLLESGNCRDPLLARELAVEMVKRLTPFIPPPSADGSVGDDEARHASFQDRPTPPFSAPSPTPARTFRHDLMNQIIERGYRLLVLKLHPDQGGDKDHMIELTSARDALRKAVAKL